MEKKSKIIYKVIEPKNLILDRCIEISKDNEAIFERGDQIYKLKLDSILILDFQKYYSFKFSKKNMAMADNYFYHKKK